MNFEGTKFLVQQSGTGDLQSETLVRLIIPIVMYHSNHVQRAQPGRHVSY